MLTKSKANELFTHVDGHLYWRISTGRAVVGAEAGFWQNSTDGRRRYRVVEVEGKAYRVHRVVFLMHYGYMPSIVDHIDRDTTNNHIENLRAATKAENNRNIVYSRVNTSGIRGVDFHKGAWRARVSVGGKSVFNKRFATLEEAEAAAVSARRDLHGTFAT